LNTKLLKKAIPELIDAFIYSVKNKKKPEYFIYLFQGVFKRFRNKPPGDFNSISIKIRNRLKRKLAINDVLLNLEKIKYTDVDSLRNIEVTLAGAKRQLCSENLWNLEHNDIEELYALHRFGWLLVVFVEGQLSWKEGFQYIIKWNVDHNIPGYGNGWDSYSISERLSNWIIFLSVRDTRDGKFEDKVLDKWIYNQAVYLIQNLEFRGPATNNHIVNNGRALYLAGLYVNIEEFKQTGQELLLVGIEHLFSPSGFLREGSSHYHILLTRTYLEVIIFAQRFKDTSFEQILIKRVEKLWEAACFFLEEQPFPVFGDISPDFLTTFHLEIVKVGGSLFKRPYVSTKVTKVGWHKFFPDVLAEEPAHEKPKKGYVSYNDAGYIRFRNERITFYAYVNPLGYVPAWSHGHADLGGFIFYLDGHRILIGAGRYRYIKNSENDYWISAKSHNSITVGNKGLCPVHGLDSLPEFILPEYFQKPVVKIIEQDDNNCFQLSLSFKRVLPYQNEVEVFRKILIGNENLTVNDQILGDGERSICSYFHFSPDLNIYNEETNSTEFKISDNTKQVELSFSYSKSHKDQKSLNIEHKSDTFGWHSPEYGTIEPCNTLCFSQLDILPTESTYLFSYQSKS